MNSIDADGRHENGANGRHEGLRRAGALAGAAAIVALGVRRRSLGAMTGAAAVALPLAYRGIAGHWPLQAPAPVEISTSLTIERSPREVYDAWRNLERLPEILRHLESVKELGERRSRWVARTAVGGTLEWEAEIVEERPGEFLWWRSLPGSDVSQSGILEFKPWREGEGTLMRVRMRMASAHGRGPAALGSFLRPVLAVQIREDLRRFKSRMEAGEIPANSPQPTGDRSVPSPTSPF